MGAMEGRGTNNSCKSGDLFESVFRVLKTIVPSNMKRNISIQTPPGKVL